MYHCYFNVMMIALCTVVFAGAQNNKEDSLSFTKSTTDKSLDPIIVTATRRAQPAEWVSDDHTIINVDRLQLSTSQTISEMLAGNIPARISDYGSGSLKNISLRGAGSERTLLLVDGKRIGYADNDLADISVNSVEKIEIIEGGQSALYGMDAIGGVVNIITKQSQTEKLSGNLSMGLSSFERGSGKDKWNNPLNGNNVNFNIGQKYENFGWMSGGNWNKSDGKFDYSDPNNVIHVRENNGFNDWEALQKVTYKGSALAIDVMGTYCDRNIGSPGKVSAPSQATTKKRIGSVSLDGGYIATNYLRLRLNSSYAHERINYTDPNPVWPQNSKHIRSRGNIEFIQEITLHNQMLNTGIQALKSEVNSTEIGRHAIVQLGIFANGIFKELTRFFQFEQTPAFRFDYASSFGSTMNGKLGMIATGNFILKPSMFINVGTSFRAPPFDYLYWPRDAYTQGNPDLKPEKSENGDVGFQFQHTFFGISQQARFSRYRLRLKDMIIWTEGAGGLWIPKNVSQASIIGFKIDWSANFKQAWNLSCKYEYSDARDKQTDKYLIYRPKSMLTFSAERFGTSFNAGATYSFSSKVFINDANTASLPYYHMVNIHSGYKIPVKINGLWIVYDMLNATNQQHSTNEGYPLPGREHRLNLKMEF
jgi:vitamin B12 transporter